MQLVLFLIFWQSESLKVTPIPASGTPPTRRYSAGAVYDPTGDRIICFGGFDAVNQEYSADLYALSLRTFTWSTILSNSEIYPPGIGDSYMYLRNDSVLLVFFGMNSQGIKSEVYSFDLITKSWRLETLAGDKLIGRSNFAACEAFVKGDNSTYLAFFGGLYYEGASDQLFL